KDSIEAFMDNPVLIAGHTYVGLSGEPTVIGNWTKVWVSQDGLEGIAEFDAELKLAQDYFGLYQRGRMKAVSVGFIAIEWIMRELDQGDRKQRVRAFTKVELLEISAVAIPANRAALMRAACFAPMHNNNAPAKGAHDDA